MNAAQEPDEPTVPSQKPPLFYEPGATWYWVLAGPLSALSLIYIQWSNHVAISYLVPVIFLVLVSAFVALQVKAARIHTSVELTEDALRQGTETILVREIVKVFPEPENSVVSGKPLARWQSARALGELVGVPRGRRGIGIKLTGGRTAQAWARRHRHLRDALTPLVEERMGPYVSELADEVDVTDDESQL
ncbi:MULTISPECIES: DUF3093 domain-containing protein [Mycobacterium]|uniref:DUF3093 domain-containing protein n=1 Tax=Mycobacterium kiyosense TaxID=2871094 RepID=A0A9P3UWY7_9MYCO|nr:MULTISPECIES: DUF3093 domain-containing protein [Mycobacterium]BDB40397.1 hypothetical protein IWGMT90018_08430 [Mycobacterium kiyosense]BDE12215.1 hypothetical protein MKCMC460_10750 [Mycobacterium sp. 20KCMC460]GLB85148.1 hypothetical protein SRL2020028_44040 [Mycobacterium kiyosense]GLB91557.1 hypothetical protein SRL2020130_43740 [Mycobacterium kiyosense]GLB95100.1 hypothetical protein SRL2020226_18760 [Mycobacterium kiyosense]